MKTDAYAEITNRIIESLEAGNIPWLKPWKDSNRGNPAIPHNAVTGRNYNGINYILLTMSEFDSTGWLTYKQAKELKGNVRKGEKGTKIVFWKFGKNKDADTGEESSYAMVRQYTVFNVDQCENLVLPKRREVTEVEIPSTLEIAEAAGAEVIHGGNKAAYYPTQDHITMPAAGQFHSEDGYSSTLLHELTHWTGSKKRLDRNFGDRFGSESYAFEELVAELGSAFLCAESGIRLENLQHDSYIKNWLKVLKNDKKAIFTASSKARISTEYILNKGEITEYK